ncbi:MAG: nuclear transport factor 2 family protein [Dyadobacter sp.]
MNQFSSEWIEAWNAHDLEKILSHYAEDIEFYSPIIKQLGTNEEGVIKDKITLRDYFRKALALYPDLYFDLHEILIGTESLILFYTSVNNKKSAEFMQFDKEGKVNFVRAHYN